MTRITNNDLHAMQARLARNMVTVGLLGPHDQLIVESGSKTYGHSFKVTTIVNGRRETPFGTLSFGFTKADCYTAMHTLCVAYETLRRGEVR